MNTPWLKRVGAAVWDGRLYGACPGAEREVASSRLSRVQVADSFFYDIARMRVLRFHFIGLKRTIVEAMSEGNGPLIHRIVTLMFKNCDVVQLIIINFAG